MFDAGVEETETGVVAEVTRSRPASADGVVRMGYGRARRIGGTGPDIVSVLDAVRKERGITTADMAQRLGVARTALSVWRLRKTAPRIQTVLRWCEVCGYDLMIVARSR